MKFISIILLFVIFPFIAMTQNVGIGTNNPETKLHIKEGNVYLEQPQAGIIITASNGTCWLMSVDTLGVVTTDSVECPVIPFPCGSPLVYDGQSYATVLIGDQCWMAENLNVGTMVNASTNQTDNGMIEKHCQEDDPANCIVYGGLYQWNEAMQFTYTLPNQSVCPTDWHLPTDDEFDTLVVHIPGIDKGSQLAVNASLWYDGALEQSASFGLSNFDALPGGWSHSGGFSGTKTYFSYFWTSTEMGIDAHLRNINFMHTGIHSSTSTKLAGYSIRCVKD